MKLLFDENLSRKLVGGRIKVVSRKQAVDGKSVLSLMLLGATPGTEITIEARGEDEGEALNALAKLVSGRFGEGP